MVLIAKNLVRLESHREFLHPQLLEKNREYEDDQKVYNDNLLKLKYPLLGTYKNQHLNLNFDKYV